MSWSYSGDPANNSIDRYRFLIGDTREDDPILQDEEIMYIVDTYGTNENVLLYQLFSRVAVLFARDIKRSLGPQAEDPTGRLEFFRDQAALYRQKCASFGLSLPPYKYPKIFGKGMHSNPPFPGGGSTV